MKIAIIAPEFIPALGGAGIYAKNLINELSKDESLELHIITPKRGSTAEKIPFKNIHVHYVSNANDTFFYNFMFQFAVAKEFPRLHKKHKFDIVHSMGLVHMPDIFLNYKKLGIPHLVTVHTTIETQFDYKKASLTSNFSPVELLSRLAYPYISFMQKKYIKNTGNFICVSEYVKKFIPKEKNIVVIKNGIETGKFASNKNSEFSYLRKLKAPKILFCGRLLYMKGLETIIYSAERLKGKAHFVIAGEGNLKKWKNKAKHGNISFLGKVSHDKINGLYNECDIFVLPSFVESFPISILEAMSSGLPVVAGSVGGIPELITHEKNGMLFDPEDKEGFVTILLNLISDRKKREKLGKKAKQDAVENYGSGMMAGRTLDFYKKILGDKNFS